MGQSTDSRKCEDLSGISAFGRPRFIHSIKSECLSQIVPLGERHLCHSVKEYSEHYHVERNHHGLHNPLIKKPRGVFNTDSAVVRHERLGGVLNYYERSAT